MLFVISRSFENSNSREMLLRILVMASHNYLWLELWTFRTINFQAYQIILGNSQGSQVCASITTSSFDWVRHLATSPISKNYLLNEVIINFYHFQITFETWGTLDFKQLHNQVRPSIWVNKHWAHSHQVSDNFHGYMNSISRIIIWHLCLHDLEICLDYKY